MLGDIPVYEHPFLKRDEVVILKKEGKIYVGCIYKFNFKTFDFIKALDSSIEIARAVVQRQIEQTASFQEKLHRFVNNKPVGIEYEHHD